MVRKLVSGDSCVTDADDTRLDPVAMHVWRARQLVTVVGLPLQFV